MKRANRALLKLMNKKTCSEIPEVDEDSENSTINIGGLEVFKVRAESLTSPYQPRRAPSPVESPEQTVDDLITCVLI